MIPENPLDDKDFMISKLCQSFQVDELPELLEIHAQCPADMDQETFDYKYTQHLRLLYKKSQVENYKENTENSEGYKKVPFSVLNKKIMKAIIGEQKENQPTKTTPSNADLLSKIAAIRSTQRK